MAEIIPPFKPRRTYGSLSVAVLAVVAVIALAAAWGALVAVEHSSRNAVERALFLSGEDWAEVEVNGLQVILSGDAPTEAARFAALSAAAHEVDGARVIDQMVLPAAVAIEPPRFSVEMLRNDAGISLIGLIPAASDREALTRRMRAIDPIQPVADFLETAEYPMPAGWENALEFTLDVAEMLPRSKISMSADSVSVEAIAAAADQKREWEQEIRRARPAGLRLALDIRAPLDVISPYTLRFLSDAQGARFDACTAYTPAGRNTIVSAGIAAGVKGAVDCTIGLGVPSPDWPSAVARGISAVRDMGGGSLTFSDADITLIAPADTPRDTFDRVIGELEADLPEVFSLHGVLSEPETGEASPAGPPEFIASLAESGAVQLRGRVATEQDRTIAETLARARFGTRKVYAPLRLDPALPAAWAVRTLAGLEALDQLAEGRVVVRPDVVTVTGTTGDRRASAEISRLLSEKLGEAEDFRVNVTYEEALDPVAAMPTPQECVADVNAALTRNKITFAPGSAEIERGSAATVDRIAEILKTCPDVAMEIGGYTDSQGREEMNQALSQRRAEAVVSALLARRVLTTNLKAFGYGEEFPIADNDTEEGREANRRIEFSLVGETRPRGEPASGEDDPTIRPLARPGDDEEPAGAAEDAVEGTGDDAAEEAAGEDVGATDAADAGTSADGAEASDAGAVPEATGDDGGDGEEETAANAAVTEESEEVAETATETAPEVTGEIATDATEPAVDPGEGASDSAEEDLAREADGEADTADGAAEATGDAAPEEGFTDEAFDAESAEADDAVTSDDERAQTVTGAEAEAATVDEVAATEEAPADDEIAAPDAEAVSPDDAIATTGTETTGADADVADAVDPADGTAQTDAPEEVASADVPALEEQDGTGAEPADADAPVLETPDIAEAEGADAPEAPATAPEAAANAEDVTEAVEAPDAPVETPDQAVSTAEADGTETDTAETDAAQVGGQSGGTEADSEAGTVDAAPSLALDIPAIRPPARPPIVVHPDLEGVRPRPRPAEVPAAPTTE